MTDFQVMDKDPLTSVDRSADYLLIYDFSGNKLMRSNVNSLLDLASHPVGIDDTQTLTNKTISSSNTITVRDDRFTLQDNSDTTKQAVFQLSGISTATTRTYTLPNVTDTLVALTATQTLTNKTLTSPTINNATIANPTLTVDSIAEYTAAAGVTIDGVLLKDGGITLTSDFTTSGDIITTGGRFTDETGPVMPIGSIIDFAGATAPTGWLFCYGQAISRTTYEDLFSIIGTTYGAGDGSTTFNLPDLRGRAVAGKDDMGGTSANRLTGATGGVNGDVLGGSGGAETHTLTTAQMPSHVHSMQARITQAGAGGNVRTLTTSTPDSNQDTVSAGGDGAHNNVQPTLILNKIIKT